MNLGTLSVLDLIIGGPTGWTRVPLTKILQDPNWCGEEEYQPIRMGTNREGEGLISRGNTETGSIDPKESSSTEEGLDPSGWIRGGQGRKVWEEQESGRVMVDGYGPGKERSKSSRTTSRRIVSTRMSRRRNRCTCSIRNGLPSPVYLTVTGISTRFVRSQGRDRSPSHDRSSWTRLSLYLGSQPFRWFLSRLPSKTTPVVPRPFKPPTLSTETYQGPSP